MSVTRQSTMADEISGMRSETLEAWGWHWLVLSPWKHFFQRDRAIPWLALQDHRDAALIKRGDQRSVWRLQVDGHALVAKVFEPLGPWGRVKTVLAGHPAQREFRAGVYCLRRGLSAVRPVACGRFSQAGAAGPHVLLTEEIRDSKGLTQYWRGRPEIGESGSRARENALAAEVAEWLARLHERMVLPFDLHPGNILIHEEHGQPVATLVDLHKMRYGKRVREIERLGNLANLNQWFRRNSSGITRMRFLFSYLTHVFGMPSPRLVKRYALDVTMLTNYDAAELQAKRDRRIFGDNKYFGILTLPDRWRAHVYLQAKRPVQGSRCSQLRFTKADWEPALNALVAPQALPGRPGEIQVGPHRVAIELQKSTGSQENLMQRWRSSHSLINRHQTVAVPLALLERRTVGRTTHSMLIIERKELGHVGGASDQAAAR